MSHAKQFLLSHLFRGALVPARLAAPRAVSVEPLAASLRLATLTTDSNSSYDRARNAQRQSARDGRQAARDASDAAAQQQTREQSSRNSSAASSASSGARSAASNFAGSRQQQQQQQADRARSANVLLNESIDAEEDKFASSFSKSEPYNRRRSESPLRSSDVLAGQARQEANINDLVDELEDKVRNLDHVKDAVAQSSADRFAQQQRARQQQDPQQQGNNNRRP